jgi:hypothetical protein
VHLSFIMAGKRTLFDVGVTSEPVAKRGAGPSTAAHVDPDADLAVVEPEVSDTPKPLSDEKVAERQRDSPWAVYVGPSHFSKGRDPVHSWRCGWCEMDNKRKVEYKFKDQYEFNRHARSERHKAAATAMELRKSMQKSRQAQAVKVLEDVTSDTGRLLVLIALMVTCGMSLKLFPQVRSLVLERNKKCTGRTVLNVVK